MPDYASALRAGGIVPTDTAIPKDERASSVSARAFTHPAIAERIVVKLAPDAIAAGVDAELDALGFRSPTVTPPLGIQRYRSLGFPGWALIHDPKRARFALEVTKEFKAAAKRARSKPGHAKDMFVVIAERLGRSVPHFLPSFWEEAGRVFLVEENTTYAAQAFEKARLAEKEHDLSVDEDARAATFLEFALAGAIAVKSLTAYARELGAALGKKEGYLRFRALAVKRTLGGMPPWAGIAKDLRSLARDAKLDLAEEDVRFLEEVLPSQALALAPAEFWSSYRPALVQLGKRSAAVRAQLANLFPTAERVAPDFVTVLQEIGALDEIVAKAPEAARGATAAWLSRMVAFVGTDSRVAWLFEQLAPRLRSDGSPVAVAYGRRWRPELQLDLCELALALDIPLAVPVASAQFSLTYAACDPVNVAVDPTYGPKLDEAVGEVIGTEPFETKARGKQGYATARRAWIARRVDAIEHAGVGGLRVAIEQLAERTTPAMFAEFPDLRGRLAKARIGACLARTLRGGIFDELGWPAYEAAFAELSGGLTTLAGVFPYLVVHSPLKAIVLSARGRELVHDFHVNRATEQLQGTYFIDGQLLVTYRVTASYEQRAYWSGLPSESFVLNAYMYPWGSPSVTPIASGGATLGEKTVRAGDTSVTSFEDHLSDGTTFWRRRWVDGKAVLREFDPRTGADGRVSWPRFAEDFLEEGKELDVAALSVLPAPPGLESSPLGIRGGLVGTRARRPLSRSGFVECESIDGRTWAAPARAGEPSPTSLLSIPGDDRPRAVAARTNGYGRARQVTASLIAPDGMVLGAVGTDEWFARGWGKAPIPSAPFWHYLTPRDEAGSAALRAVTDEVAQALLDAARDDRAAASVPRLLPAVNNEKLRAGIAGVAVEAAHCGRLLEEKVLARTPMVAETHDDPIVTELSQVAAALGGGEHRSISMTRDWFAWIGNVRAYAIASLAPCTSKAERDDVHAVLRAWGASGFADGISGVRVFEASVPADSETAKRFEEEAFEVPLPKSWSAGASRYLGRSTKHYYGPRKIDIVERTHDGTFRDPPDATLANERRVAGPPDREWIARFLEVVAPADPPPYVEAIAKTLAVATGLTRAEAALLWIGAPDVTTWGADFLGKERREALGLKVAEAAAARDTFRPIARADILAMLGAAASGDPEDLLQPLVPGAGGKSVVERLAEAWLAQRGERTPVPEELAVMCDRELGVKLPAVAVLGALADTDRSPLLRVERRPIDELVSWNPNPTPDGFDRNAMSDLAIVIAYLAFALPVGDPWRDRIPQLHRRVLDCLRDPELLVPLGQTWATQPDRSDLRRVIDALGGETVPSANADVQRDTGRIVIAIVGHSLHIAFRPARVARLDEDEELFKLATSMNGRAHGLETVAFLSSDGCRAIVARIADTPVPRGKYEADPRASIPQTVARAAKKLSLDEDAAALYLQLLGLPEPTAKAIQRFNDWTPKAYKRAAEALAEQGLVVAGKRERAGREIFLPGAWVKRTGKDLPIEAWKLPLYAMKHGALARSLPVLPIHETMERAWKRIEDGDKPALEEVR